MPQIDQIAISYLSQIFWLLLVFALIYFVIGKSMLPKVEQTIDARAHRIAEDLAAAERARAKADGDELAYRNRLAEARAGALQRTQDAKRAAALDSEAKVKAADVVLAGKAAEADARLADARQGALAGIESVAAEAARDIVAKLTGVSVGEDVATQAARAALAAQTAG